MGILICDVAGKGVPASLVMVMIRTLIHSQATAEQSTLDTVLSINQGISGDIEIDRYATMSYLKLDLQTGDIEYTNAAHHPTLIYRSREASFEMLDNPGLPIGVDVHGTYGTVDTRVNPGDILVCYTDGIVEMRDANGDFYGEERLRATVAHHARDATAENLRDHILHDIESFCGVLNERTQQDDMTLIIWKPIAT